MCFRRKTPTIRHGPTALPSVSAVTGVRGFVPYVPRVAARAATAWLLRGVTLLRLRALLAQAHGDEAGYCDYRDRYRAMATSLGFEGHMKWAEAMP